MSSPAKTTSHYSGLATSSMETPHKSRSALAAEAVMKMSTPAPVHKAATFPQSATEKKTALTGSVETPTSPKPVYGVTDGAYDHLADMIKADGLNAVFAPSEGTKKDVMAAGKENKK